MQFSAQNQKIAYLTVLGIVAYAAIAVVSWLDVLMLFSQGRLFARTIANSTNLFINDFTLFYAMGKLAASAQSHLVYNPVVQDQFLNQLISPLHTGRIFYDQHVPWHFLLFVPLTIIPLAPAYLAWSLIGMIGSSLTLAFVCLRLRKTNMLVAVFMVALMNAGMPAWFQLMHGNFAWLLVVLLSLFCLFYFAEREILAGITLALLSLKPHYALMLAMPALATRRYKLLLSAVLSEIILLSAAGGFIGFDNLLGYPSTLLAADANGSYEGIYPHLMVSLRALYATLLPASWAMPLSLITLIASCVFLYVFWRNVSVGNTLKKSWAMAFTIIFILVTSPHSNVYDLLLICIAGCLTFPCQSFLSGQLARRLAYLWNLLWACFPIITWWLFLSEDKAVLFQHWPLFAFELVLLFLCGLIYRSLPKSGLAEAKFAD
jgi:hypothetical protein